jgi:hypothetical protein
MSSEPEFGAETVLENKICAGCGNAYSIEDYFSSSPSYFDAPYNYKHGCATYCLGCWLGLPNAKSEDETSL